MNALEVVKEQQSVVFLAPRNSYEDMLMDMLARLQGAVVNSRINHA